MFEESNQYVVKAENDYSKHVSLLVALIDSSQTVNVEFIECAISDELSALEAASSWFEGTEFLVDFTMHLSGDSGLLDIEFKGIDDVKRVVLSQYIQKGDIFNIYYGDSSKGGGTWNTDLISTLNEYFNA
jgi:hypothetical protein